MEKDEKQTSDKEIIQILIKNTSELNNKIEALKNIEKKHLQEQAKLSVELIEYKADLKYSKEEILKLREELKKYKNSSHLLDNKQKEIDDKLKEIENKEQLEEPKKELEEEPKKKIQSIDFLEQKNKFKKSWGTLERARQRNKTAQKISQLKPPQKIEV
jgi:hypothetical protein